MSVIDVYAESPRDRSSVRSEYGGRFLILSPPENLNPMPMFLKEIGWLDYLAFGTVAFVVTRGFMNGCSGEIGLFVHSGGLDEGVFVGPKPVWFVRQAIGDRQQVFAWIF